jgi:catechol 2,3-dioxygenase-like lactoylglutathione lyase family enzyme
MPLARYKDLCIDAVDPERLGRFWAAALGLEQHSRGDQPAPLTGPTKQHTLWVNPVPEPKAVKHRIHIDVNASSVEELVAAGARVLDDRSLPWTVMADPEGGEFCVFVRSGVITQRLYELGVDSSEPHRIAAWWAEVLGGRLVDDERGFSYVDEIPGAPFDSMDFAPVPEPKTVKNRIHLDVETADVRTLVAAGATVVRLRDRQIDWDVLADPEGNEFCAFTRADVSGH